MHDKNEQYEDQKDFRNFGDLYNCALKSIRDIQCLLNEITYLMDDSYDIQRRRNVKFAFEHLQRKIVAIPEYKDVWNNRKKEIDQKLPDPVTDENKDSTLQTDQKKKKEDKEKLTETAFEKLGAEHLLYHKIWAFKSHAAGERTDLILNEHIKENDNFINYAESLVLTEWKVCNDGKYEKLVAEAKIQAKSYIFGSLGALELDNVCFIVIVSEKKLFDTYDRDEGNMKFQIINIAYDPDTPSVGSKT